MDSIAGCVADRIYENGLPESAVVYRPSLEAAKSVIPVASPWRGEASVVVAYGEFRSDVDQLGSDDKVEAIWLVIPDDSFNGAIGESICDETVEVGEWATVPALVALGPGSPIPAEAWPPPPPSS